ncbi:PIN domain-containing protein [Sphingomonas sp. RHCKR7]|uniref:PIN domain-containing protein n=1 Tax=Sphingomonas folli TaxID=2862497 RepID=UPI001C666849|nr:PIN domain-containing protein [Sphingomonas folli]MBW6528704.1 PIN domain-containing protein [Sphingomonas folli]
MFANRYTAFIDACTLAGTLKRNLLLSLAEAEFFRVRWSEKVLDETQAAIEKILTGKGVLDSADRAQRARKAMEIAFEEAVVSDYDLFLPSCEDLPDAGDAHVLAAALKTQAATIVTENLKDFPESHLSRLNLEARSADSFIADTIALDPGRAVAAIRKMRERFKRPGKTAEDLLLEMEADGLTQTVDILRQHVLSL